MKIGYLMVITFVWYIKLDELPVQFQKKKKLNLTLLTFQVNFLTHNLFNPTKKCH